MHITCVLRKYVLVWVSLKRKKKKKTLLQIVYLIAVNSKHKDCNCFILVERMVDIVRFGCLLVWKIL